jgi:hypothetical protein
LPSNTRARRRIKLFQKNVAVRGSHRGLVRMKAAQHVLK